MQLFLKSLVKVKLSTIWVKKMEKVKLRNRKSSHRIALVFIEKWNPKSTELRTLFIRYKYGSNSPMSKTSTFQVRMSEWDKKEQSLNNKENHVKLSD
tara:strand:+ start:368 stop:658 length:291 start_codon:yes stop_codon:yes gene_type:complete